MTDVAVTPQIIQSLATYLKRAPSSITESHHLRDDLGLDSVAVIELLFEIEDRFKIQIPDQDLPGLSTVGSVTAYVQQRLSSSSSTPAKAKPTTPAVSKKKAPAPKKALASKKASVPKKASATKKKPVPKKASTTKNKKR
ncbi:MAG: acyl carrier protein [Nitrospira sp.]|nr:acyl carrier protein [Nitrospira sp.]MDH4235980.1 acyl carrier protein [Nitrospira sp.]MDH4327985.1 acyl carrier protein [Nitrospira sp.]MDH5252049.1 acyl carrier protein [Nitrospira sp.]